MHMNHLQKTVFIFMVFTAITCPSAAAKTKQTTPNQGAMNFSITDLLQNQATQNLYSLIQSTGNEVRKMLQTPEHPTKWQLRRQKGQDWFCTWQGSKKVKAAKIFSWLSGAGTIGGFFALWGAAPWRPDYKEPTITDQASHAAFSLAALAAQTYIAKRAGFSSSKPITIGNIIETVKQAAQRQAERTYFPAKTTHQEPLVPQQTVTLAPKAEEPTKIPQPQAEVSASPFHHEQQRETLQKFFGE